MSSMSVVTFEFAVTVVTLSVFEFSKVRLSEHLAVRVGDAFGSGRLDGPVQHRKPF